MKEEFLNETNSNEDDEKYLVASRQSTLFTTSSSVENEINKKRLKYINPDPYNTNIYPDFFSFLAFI